MAKGFTDYEKEAINAKLLVEAQKYASTTGMRNVSLDRIVADAGISKPAFYKFYKTKEHLFLQIVVDWHTEMTQRCIKLIEQRTDLPMEERVVICVLDLIQYVTERNMLRFLNEDVPYIIRKLPDAYELLERTHDNYLHPLLDATGLEFTVDEETLTATIHMLMFAATRREEIGEKYPQAMELMVRSVVDRLIEGD